MRQIGHHRFLVLIAALAVTSCGTDWGLLITVRCDVDGDPPCDLAIPTEIDALRINLTQPSASPPPLDRTYSLGAGDAFPLGISVLAGDGAEEGTVLAEVDALLDTVVVAEGTASGPLREDRQVEIIIELQPL